MAIRDISFPFRKGVTSFPAMVEGDSVLADNIRRILLTPQGSRVMRPDVGSNLWEFIFDNVGPVLMARIDYEVRRAIAAGEPRVRVLQVSTDQVDLENGDTKITVEVYYEANGVVGTTSAAFVQP